MKKRIYCASFSTSNGSYCENDYVFTNKKETIKAIREIGMANAYIGGSVSLTVCDENNKEVYSRTINVK